MKLVDNSLKSFYVKGKLPQWAIWTIGAALFAIAWYAVSVWARYEALRELSLNVDFWTEDGILEQQNNYSCVPVSIVMLLKDQGIVTTTFKVARVAGTDIRGTSSGGITRTGNQYGFEVVHERMGFNDFLGQEHPSIIIFRYQNIRHAVYLTPMPQLGLVRVKDPVQGLLYFQKIEADEYFHMETWDLYIFQKQE